MARDRSLRIALAQINLLVGDVRGNLARVIAEARRARDELRRRPGAVSGADAVAAIRPRTCCSIAACGCRSSGRCEELQQAVPEIGVLFGYPEYHEGQIYNAAQLLRGGQVLGASPQGLPAELPGVRREALFHRRHRADRGRLRWLSPGTADLRGHLGAGAGARPHSALGAEALLIINASPYEIHKQREREQVRRRSGLREVGVPVVYVNLVGGQDELVFDGNSFVMDAQGQLAMRAGAFEEGLFCVELRTAARTA